MTAEEMQAILDKVPDLSIDGIGLDRTWRKKTQEEKDERLASWRKDMLKPNSLERTTAVVEWLSQFTKIKTPNMPTHWIKSVFERRTRKYATNGEVMAAAFHCGFTFKISERGMDIGLSERSFKELANATSRGMDF